MKKMIIFLICLVVLAGILIAYSQMTLQEADETIARCDKILEQAERRR